MCFLPRCLSLLISALMLCNFILFTWHCMSEECKLFYYLSRLLVEFKKKAVMHIRFIFVAFCDTSFYLLLFYSILYPRCSIKCTFFGGILKNPCKMWLYDWQIFILLHSKVKQSVKFGYPFEWIIEIWIIFIEIKE